MLRRTKISLVALVVGALIFPFSAVSPANAAVDDATLTLTKSNTAPGGVVGPDQSYEYEFEVGCTSFDFDCADAVFTDTLPEGITVDTLPTSTADYTVVYAEATRVLTITFTQVLTTPTGTGLKAGAGFTVALGVSVPPDTTLADQSILSNTASLVGSNALEVTSTSTVEVDIPRDARPVGTKKWLPTGSFVGDDNESTVTLGITNVSSPTSVVTRLTITDETPDTYEYLNFTGATVTRFPAGADRAQLWVKTLDGDYVAGTVSTGTGALVLPAGISADQVAGVRVEFFSSTGAALPYDATGGTVDLGMVLRDTLRSDGSPLTVIERQTINNCATPGATEEELGQVSGANACVNHFIYPDTAQLTVSKKFFPDANGNFTQNAGEYAVVGLDSGVSAAIDVTNSAPFPLGELIITEPSPTQASEFDKVSLEKVRLRFPAGATVATVVVEYENGPSVTTSASGNETLSVGIDGDRVTTVTITYRGIDADGQPLIQPGAVAGVDVHGTIPGNQLTDDELASGTSPGVDNCAAATGVALPDNGTGTAAGTACAVLEVVPPFTEYDGTKTANQTVVVAGQPVTYRLTVTNNGTIPMVNPVLSDPPLTPAGLPDPAYQNVFDILSLQQIRVVSPAGEDAVTLEVHRRGGGWEEFDGSLVQLIRADAFRGTLNGSLAPASSIVIDLVFELGADDPLGAAVSNCFQFASGNLEPVAPECAPQVTSGERQDSAALNKRIEPAELPEYSPGLPAQKTSVTLEVTNTGTLNAQTLLVQDQTESFFDATNFVQVTAIRYPAGAHHVELQYLLADGTWTPAVSSTSTGAQALPSGVSAGDVRGVRGAFKGDPIGENGGYTMTHCAAGGSCHGEVVYSVEARQTLRSDPVTAIPTTLTNTVTGQYHTISNASGELTDIPPANATLAFVPGTVQLDVNKTPNVNLTPGTNQLFRLTVQNTGTGPLPDLVVVDQLPDKLTLNEEFAGDTVGGVVQPYRIVNVQLPDGTPPVPTPELELVRGGDHVDQAVWRFPDNWVLPVGGTFVIELEASLAPGVVTHEEVTNTMGATSDGNADLSCLRTNSGQTDVLGAGLYCTDTATVTTQAGAGFETRKWISGNPELGWYNTRTSEYLPEGDNACPALNYAGEQYTTTPCIALTNPGEEFDYLLKIVNAGTEPAERMVIVDRLPAPNDDGVTLPNRGTTWDNAPTLSAAPVVHHDTAAATVTYAGDPDLCLDDLDLTDPRVCSIGRWLPEFSSTAPAFGAALEFGDELLAPGAGFEVTFSMRAPIDITQSGSPTIAWNSIARSADTVRDNGEVRHLTTLEALKVGIGVSYGTFDVVKRIGSNTAGVNVDELEFGFDYVCTIPQGDAPLTVRTGHIDITGSGIATVQGVPAGATCSVWEGETRGGVSSAPEGAPVTFVVPAQFGLTVPGSGTAPAAVISNAFEAPTVPPTTPPTGPGTPGQPGGPGDPEGSGGGLAVTGTPDATVLFALGGLLLALGGALAVTGARTRRHAGNRAS